MSNRLEKFTGIVLSYKNMLVTAFLKLNNVHIF